MEDKYTLVVNDVDLTNLVEIDSYATSLDLVYGDSIRTLDGVEHVSVLRYRGVVKFSLNPMPAAKYAAVCEALLETPLQVCYHCLQRNTEILAKMKLSSTTAKHLGRVRFAGQKWHEISSITLTEL